MKVRSPEFGSVVVRPLQCPLDAGDPRADNYEARARRYQLAATALGCKSLEEAIVKVGMPRVLAMTSSGNISGSLASVSESGRDPAQTL